MGSIKVTFHGASSYDTPPQDDSNSSKPMEEGDLKLLASKIGRLHLGKTKLSGVPEESPKATARQYSTGGGGGTTSVACNNNQAETASHVVCYGEDSAELRPRRLGKHFM
jgi:hypothetical protein